MLTVKSKIDSKKMITYYIIIAIMTVGTIIVVYKGFIKKPTFDDLNKGAFVGSGQFPAASEEPVLPPKNSNTAVVSSTPVATVPLEINSKANVRNVIRDEKYKSLKEFYIRPDIDYQVGKPDPFK